jgi:chromosome segregation ATPase
MTPVQSAPSPHIEGADEEIQQLRTNLSNLTAQCAQLDEANRAWQQFHQNQLEIFRNKLQDWILLDENSTLEQLAQQIVIQLDQLANNKQNTNQSDTTIESLNNQLINYQLNESMLAQNLEQLNQKLVDVHQECEEFREHNAQLILSKQQLEQQLEERQQLINDLQQQNNSFYLENQQLQSKLNDMEQRLNQLAVQRVDSPREVCV